MLPSEHLSEMGIKLPEVVPPVAAYIPAIKLGASNMIQTSGQLPVVAGKLVATGALGEDGDVSVEDAAAAAQVCALNAIAAAANIAGGIDQLTGVIKVTGFVASIPGFTDQAAVINGASEFLGKVFEDAHARSAVGVAALPLGAAVEVEVLFSTAG